MAGTVDTKNVTVTNLDAKQTETDEAQSGLYSVKVSDKEKATLGEVEIAMINKDDDEDGMDDELGSDGKSVFVQSKAVTEDSQVFVTSKTMLDQPLVVTEIRPGEGFKVAKKDPTNQDSTFSWWIVNKL